nr:LysR substrate-binding domain-containing protein [Paracoccus limosus]
MRDLAYLIALADHRSFRLAAEVCNVSQPTLSTQIRRLEEELGVALFERAPRNLILTPAGEAAVRRARRIHDELRQMRDEASGHGAEGLTQLHLGVFPTLGPYLLPHILPGLTARFPKLALKLTEEKSAELLAQLIDGRLDAVILGQRVEDAHVTGTPLFREPFRLAVPAAHPLAGQPRVAASDLAGQKLMLLEEGHCLRDQALDLCRQSGAEEYDGFRGTSLETLRHMVMAGMGLTLMPALACLHPLGQPQIAAPAFAEPDLGRDIGLYWRKSTTHGALMQDIAGLMRAQIRDLLAPAAPPAGKA